MNARQAKKREETTYHTPICQLCIPQIDTLIMTSPRNSSLRIHPPKLVRVSISAGPNLQRYPIRVVAIRYVEALVSKDTDLRNGARSGEGEFWSPASDDGPLDVGGVARAAVANGDGGSVTVVGNTKTWGEPRYKA